MIISETKQEFIVYINKMTSCDTKQYKIHSNEQKKKQ